MAGREERSAKGDKSSSWWQTTAALLPCALIAGAWGAAVAMPGQAGPVDAAAYTAYDEGAPDVPVSGPNLQITPGQDPVEQQSLSQVAAPLGVAAPAAGIPGPALAAYQRAASVMAATKPECKLSWELLAAIGRVESNHGQFGGATVTSTGATTRAIIGIPLDGTNNTARIPDTDKGAWDGDATWDRAVGPMQFIPSTWQSVGVDADGDGKADPNNINDAALGAAVYLCVGGHDLSTEAGARAALMSYNRSTAYADQVLAIARSYSSANPLGLLPNAPYPGAPSLPLGPLGPAPLSPLPGGPEAGSSQPTPTIVALTVKPPKPVEPPKGGLTLPPTNPPKTPPPTKPTDPTTPPPTKPTDPTTPPPTDPTTPPPTDPTDPTTPPSEPPTQPDPTTPPPSEPSTPSQPDPTDPPTTSQPAPEPTATELAQGFCAGLNVSGDTLDACVSAYVDARPNGKEAAEAAATAVANR